MIISRNFALQLFLIQRLQVRLNRMKIEIFVQTDLSFKELYYYLMKSCWLINRVSKRRGQMMMTFHLRGLSKVQAKNFFATPFVKSLIFLGPESLKVTQYFRHFCHFPASHILFNSFNSEVSLKRYLNLTKRS